MKGEEICVQKNSHRSDRISLLKKRKQKHGTEDERKKNMYPKEESYPRICKPEHYESKQYHHKE